MKKAKINKTGMRTEIRSNANYMTKKDASKYAGLPIGSLNIMVGDGRVKTEIVGRMLMIPVSEADKLKAELEERKRLRVKPEDWNYSGVNF